MNALRWIPAAVVIAMMLPVLQRHGWPAVAMLLILLFLFAPRD